MSMSPRDRVLTALRGGVPDRVPKAIGFTPGALETFQAHTDGIGPAEYFETETRGLGLAPTRLETDFRPFYSSLPDSAMFSEWGVASVSGNFHHFRRLHFPMAEFTSSEQIEAYPFPDVTADYRYAELPARSAAIRQEGFASSATISSHNYVAAWQLRGLEQFLVDMLTEPHLARAIIERTTAMSCVMAARFARAGIDIIVYGEDIASQRGLVMDPGMWREWLKPRLKQVIDAAHSARPEALFMYHSDGDVTAVIPELIEVGVDILNPLQPECMDVARIKSEFGSEIAFWGGISVQQTMPWGTPEEVRNEVRERMATVGRNGGYLIGPSHTIEPEVPFENISALKRAIDEFGVYDA